GKCIKQPARVCKVFFLLTLCFHNYLSSLLDCPPTCTCSTTEIYCNKSDGSKFFPLLSFQGTGGAGNSTGGIEDLFQNITSIHIENWTGLQVLRDVDIELYTGLERLTITRSSLHTIQTRVFSKNPHLRHMTCLSEVVFACGCEIRWLQLWQQRGEAGLSSQQLYCTDGYRKILLQDMNISSCDLPDISVSHSNLTVIEGDRVTAICNGSGSPLPEVDWPVNGLHSINAQEVRCEHALIHQDGLNSFPPSIIRLKEPERRHDTCIEFTVRGSPHPTLRWFRKDQSRVCHVYYIEGCLTFKNPTHHDNGNYTLEATNYLGVATSTVYGHFLDRPFDGKSLTPPTPEPEKTEEDTTGISIAVGLAGFACVMLVVLFLLINKYGRRSKFGMKGKKPGVQSTQKYFFLNFSSTSAVYFLGV
uniref:Ig-like domain-containing protein n=1 Tax=Cynoglossus semilaevis TaxID=244447 RepID=A0A3P8UMU9_CYNSE